MSSRKFSNSGEPRRYTFGFGICLLLLYSLYISNETTQSAIARSLQRIEVFAFDSPRPEQDHHFLIKQWRKRYKSLCEDDHSTKEDMLGMLESFLQPSTPVKAKEADVEPCKNVFLDFGANVGDSLGKFIDSGIESCPAKGLEKNPQLDLNTITYGSGFHRKDNRLVRSSRRILQEMDLAPEDYCYFGIEGNPRFTNGLKAIEERVMYQTHPRPVQKAHFFTETVGSEKDGPTILYLDTVNKDQNFWGSSTLAHHRDVQKSAQQHGANSEQLEAPVDGITLSTLLQQTVQRGVGGHALIKMDIEGGEFGVLEEAYESGVLCQYAQGGTVIHLILETHRPDVIGLRYFDLQHWRHVQQTFKDCGVVIQKGREVDT